MLRLRNYYTWFFVLNCSQSRRARDNDGNTKIILLYLRKSLLTAARHRFSGIRAYQHVSGESFGRKAPAESFCRLTSDQRTIIIILTTTYKPIRIYLYPNQVYVSALPFTRLGVRWIFVSVVFLSIFRPITSRW